MNNTCSAYTTDPVAFAAWVAKVADINEAFSEAMHDAADIVVGIDQVAALGLYRAADTARETVNALRTIVPPKPRPPIPASFWLGYGLLCGLLGAFVARS